MSFIKNNDGKSQIVKDLAFCELLGGVLPNDDVILTDILDYFDTSVRERDSRITTGAVSNAHGDWYEWFLAITAWNHFINNTDSHLALLLPNISQFEVARLYEKRLYDLISDLKVKVSEASGVELITSNPDFVVIDGNLAREVLREQNYSQITDIAPEALSLIENAYSFFVDKCNFNQLLGYISVKTSLRPDRRLQIAHEGSLMKALYAHLQTREWITNPHGLRYYAISTKMTEPDKNALKTVATHSLTTVFTLPQAAVDDVFEVNSLTQAKQAFSVILS